MDAARSDWALARGLEHFKRRLRHVASRVPRAIWRRAAWQSVAGLAAVLAVTALLTLGARATEPTLLRARDGAWLLQVAEGPMSFQAAIFWQALGASSFLVPALALALGIALWAGRPLRAAALGAGFAGAKAIAGLGWTLWSRARPELIADGLASPPLHSFPSGHAIQAVAFFGLLAAFWIGASRSRLEQALAVSAVVAVAALVGWSRVRLGVHWPSDIAAGTLLGGLWLAVLVAVLRRAEQTAEPPPG